MVLRLDYDYSKDTLCISESYFLYDISTRISPHDIKILGSYHPTAAEFVKKIAGEWKVNPEGGDVVTTEIESWMLEAFEKDLARKAGEKIWGSPTKVPSSLEDILWVVSNPCGFNDDDRCWTTDAERDPTIDYDWLQKNFHSQYPLGRNPSIAELMNGVYHCKTSKADCWYELFVRCTVSFEPVKRELTVTLSVDHGS